MLLRIQDQLTQDRNALLYCTQFTSTKNKNAQCKNYHELDES